MPSRLPCWAVPGRAVASLELELELDDDMLGDLDDREVLFLPPLSSVDMESEEEGSMRDDEGAGEGR